MGIKTIDQLYVIMIDYENTEIFEPNREKTRLTVVIKILEIIL